MLVLSLTRKNEPKSQKIKKGSVKILATSIIMMSDILYAAFGIFFCEVIIPLRGKRMNLITMVYEKIFPNMASYVILSITALIIFIGFIAICTIIPILGGVYSLNPSDRWCVIGRMIFVIVNNIAYVADPSLQIFWLWVAPQTVILFALVTMQIITKPILDLQMYLYIGSDFLFFQFYIYLLLKHYFNSPISSSMLITLVPSMLFYFLLIYVLHRRSNLQKIGKKAFYSKKEIIYHLNKAIIDKNESNYNFCMYLLTLNKQCFTSTLDNSDDFPTSYINAYYNLGSYGPGHEENMLLSTIHPPATNYKKRLSLSLLTIMLTGNIFKALYMLKEIIFNSSNCFHKIEAYYIAYTIGSKILDGCYFQNKTLSTLDLMAHARYSKTLETFVDLSHTVIKSHKQLIIALKNSLSYGFTISKIKSLYTQYSKLIATLSDLEYFKDKKISLFSSKFIKTLPIASTSFDKSDFLELNFEAKLPLIIQCSLFDKFSISSISNYCENQIGYSKEELIGKSLLILIPPQFRNDHCKTINDILDTKAKLRCPNHAILLTKDGYIKYYEIHVTILPIILGSSLNGVITLHQPDAFISPKFIMCLNTNFTISSISQECDNSIFEDIIKDETKFDKIIGHKYEVFQNIGKPIVLKEKLNNMVLQIQSMQMNNNLLGYLAMFNIKQTLKIRHSPSHTALTSDNGQILLYDKIDQTTDTPTIIKILINIAIAVLLSYIVAMLSISSHKIQSLTQDYFTQQRIISGSLSALYFDKAKTNDTENSYMNLVFL